MRYGELIYRRSDLVIWDEVDRGMAFLDSVFNPNQELIEFLDTLRIQIVGKLAQKRRKDLKDSSLNNWQSIHTRLQAATDRIIHFVTRDGSNSLTDWLTEKADYFTEKTLFDRIIEELFENNDSEEYKQLSKEIEDYLSSKANPRNPHYSILSNVTNNLILGQDRNTVRSTLHNWLKQHKTIAEEWDNQKWNDIIDRLRFTLLIHAFA